MIDFNGSNDPIADVINFLEAKRKRDLEEEKRLERMVIERWTGKETEDGNETNS